MNQGTKEALFDFKDVLNLVEYELIDLPERDALKSMLKDLSARWIDLRGQLKRELAKL